MINKIKISKDEQKLIHFMDENEIDIFTYQELLNNKDLKISGLHLTLESMSNREFINIIEKGKYCRHNFRDEYVIGNYLAYDGIIELPLSVWKRSGII
ncbi:MAG: hypothetical protein EPN37_08020 [Chitinophagaceae bacterium]|nr:MAG: hypothetical protein EPN37_08020 [Chitinophagaceae bacterium]